MDKAWTAGVIDALATRLKPAFRQTTPSLTIDGELFWNSAIGTLHGIAARDARVAILVAGRLTHAVAERSGAWSVTLSVPNGRHTVTAWQGTRRGIAAPVTATLSVVDDSGSPWLLASGTWNDDGVWDDGAAWIDGA